MKALWICLLLVGCAEIGQGLRGGGGAMSDDVYRAQNGLPQREQRNTDMVCMTDCAGRYSRAYCEKECSY